MNTDIFDRLFDSDKTIESIVTICRSEAPLISVLTLHLTCESFLEAFISGRLDICDLFSNKPDNSDDVSFRMTFEHKNKLSQRLGMPRAAYDALFELNQIRNQFAHKLLHAEIPADKTAKIIDLVNSIKSAEIEIELSEEGIVYHPDNHDDSFTYRMSDQNTPVMVKLCIAYFSLFRRVALKFAE